MTAPLTGLAGLDVLTVRRPSEIINSGSLGDAPLLLAIGFAVLAAISLAFAVAASVRRHGRDLAVLRSLGFTRRQVATTVAWHSTAVMVVGLVVGVPLGIFGSRALWRLFADQIDVVSRAETSAVTIGVLTIVALLIADVVALAPGRSASRGNVAIMLQSA